MVDVHTKRILVNLLWQYGIPPDDDIFETADGLALLANLINWSAKTIDYEWYEIKPYLVEMALEMHNHAWVSDGIAYIETCCGQVSFHVFDEVEDVTGRTPEKWSGVHNQHLAAEMLREWLWIDGTPGGVQ